LLSIILLSYNSGERLNAVHQLVKSHLEAESIPYELIIMDDGSTDQSFAIAKNLENDFREVRAYRLSKNFTSPYSQFAGMSVAKGNCISPMADDFQKPIEVIVQMYRKWEAGAKIVICHRTKRNDGILTNFFANSYYWMMNHFSSVNFPIGGSDGMLVDREVADILIHQIKQNSSSPIMEVLKLGFDPVLVPFERPASKTKSRWTFRKKIKLAADTFFSSSSVPIRFITVLGFSIFFLSLCLIILIVCLKLFSDNQLFGLPIQGWTTLVILLCLFNGLILFSLGIVAEYIWRIYEISKGNPPFIIRKDDHQKDDHTN